jgi:two-component sensor histidine kinase
MMRIVKLFCLLIILFGQNTQLFAQNEHIIDSLKSDLKLQTDQEKRLITISNIVRYTLYNQNDTAQVYSSLFLKEASNAGDTSETARGYNLLGMCFSAKGLHEKAIEHYLKAMPIYENLKDTFMTAMMFNNIAASYQFRKRHSETMDYYEKALQLFRSINDKEWTASVMFNMAEQLNEVDKTVRAYEIYRDCARTFGELGNDLFKGYSYTGMGNSKQQMLKYKEAILLYDTAISFIDTSLDILSYTVVQGNLCQCYRELNDWSKADFSCAENLRLALNSKAIREIGDAYKNNMDYQEKRGNFKEAYEYSKLYRLYADSLFSSDKDELMLEMLTKYDTEKKEKEIALKDLEILGNAERQKLFVLIIVLVFLILAAVAYVAFTKSKTNRELKDKGAIIQKALDEKEVLLKEIHHRVKNNLQVVSSLLSIQSRDITDEKALEAVNESRNRVKSMAIIHQNLYSEDNLTGIDLKSYVTKLAGSLFNSYKVDQDEIEFVTDIDEMILDVDTTIPMGLILNELITNALKYAFVGRETGLLKVSLKEQAGGLELIVQDNGVGINTQETRKDSFGMKMIEAFAQKLNASHEVSSGSGTTVKLLIKNYKKSA